MYQRIVTRAYNVYLRNAKGIVGKSKACQQERTEAEGQCAQDLPQEATTHTLLPTAHGYGRVARRQRTPHGFDRAAGCAHAGLREYTWHRSCPATSTTTLCECLPCCRWINFWYSRDRTTAVKHLTRLLPGWLRGRIVKSSCIRRAWFFRYFYCYLLFICM